MPNPQFVEQKSLSLSEVKEILQEAEKRDNQLNFLSTKTKEYLETFVPLSANKREELAKKLNELGVTRLKDEITAKIVDFLPRNANDLKNIVQAYNLTLSKKDQDSIIEVVSKFVKE
jgi:DNA-directed RNA polymerase subunit F